MKFILMQHLILPVAEYGEPMDLYGSRCIR